MNPWVRRLSYMRTCKPYVERDMIMAIQSQLSHIIGNTALLPHVGPFLSIHDLTTVPSIWLYVISLTLIADEKRF